MSKTSTLDAIGLKHGTDKASSNHNYLELYEVLFASLRDKNLTLLEIGVLNGASLKTWEEYFPNANVVGVDIVPTSKLYERGRITISLADQSNIEELTRLAVKHGPFDIIIEDGSHMWNHQITSLRTLFPFLKNNGLYIVEDLQTNYGSMQADYKGVASSSCVEFLKSWLDLLVANDQIRITDIEDPFLRTYGRAAQFITFYRRACLIKKLVPSIVWEMTAGQPLVPTANDDRYVKLSVLAHISNVGDIIGPSGFVNIGSDASTFQGLAIYSDVDAIEYRVRFRDGSWSAWTRNSNFAGTRGQSMLLTGFTVRLLENEKERHTLRSLGRFVGVGNPIEVSDGEDCVSKSGEALCGIQIELARLLEMSKCS